jgi:hypothetical protein
MRSAGPWLRSAVNPGVRTITLKGPTGTNQGSSISQAFSVFRGAKDLTLKDDPNGDQFTNDHAKELASFGTLQSLTLDKTTGLTGAALTGLTKNLQSLKMMGTDEVTDEHLKSLPQNLKTFVSLHTGITDAGMTNLPKGLETLGLTGGYANAGLKDLPPNLKRFFVGSQEVNDAGIKSLPKTLNQLDIVSSNVTGSAIKDIPESVHTLGLPFSYRNMNDGLKDISKNVHTLTVAHDVDDAAITSLPKTVRNVHLMGDVSSERLQQLQNARTGTKITAETRASYLDKIRLTFRRDGWVGGEPETPSSHKG